MAISNFNLPMNIHNIQQMPIRNRPTKYAESPLAERFRFEVSEGIRPAEYFGVYKYMPALLQDITTEDYLAIPKGRLVSSLSTEDSVTGTMATPSGAGTVYSFTSQTTDTLTTRSMDTSYFGYDEYMTNLLVFANGGTSSTLWYTSTDVTAGSLSPSGLAFANGGMVIPANYPIGAVFQDIYQDIRGRWTNYRMWKDGYHVLCDFYVEVPYVKVPGINTVFTPGMGSGVTPVPDGTYAEHVSKFDINKKFTYLTVDQSIDTFVPGVWIKSDILGNYTIEGTGNRSVQTIGKLIGIDNRFPKAGMDEVQTYPGSDMPGTQTAGLPSFLFEFVRQVYTTLAGTAPTVEQILSFVQAGYYGVARIQLSVA